MYEKKRKCVGTVAAYREDNKQYTDILKVLEYYSDKFNYSESKFKGNNRVNELCAVINHAYNLLYPHIQDPRLEIHEKLK